MHGMRWGSPGSVRLNVRSVASGKKAAMSACCNQGFFSSGEADSDER